MIDDGGPAYPTARKEDGYDWTEDGMSLRDHSGRRADVASSSYAATAATTVS
jgi:hypothetical protein